MGGGVFLEWTSKEMFGMVGNYQDGADFLQGKIVLGLAVAGAALLFFRARLASVAGAAGILTTLWFFFTLSGKSKPELGVWATIGGGVLLILGALIARNR